MHHSLEIELGLLHNSVKCSSKHGKTFSTGFSVYLMNDKILVAGMMDDGITVLPTGMHCEGKRTLVASLLQSVSSVPCLQSLQV